MVALSNKSLLHFENLTLPSFQVIVMTANMGCAQCRKRVSQVVSKVTGLREYTVDVSNKQVTVKGDFGYQRNVKMRNNSLKKQIKDDGCPPLKFFFRSFLACCFCV